MDLRGGRKRRVETDDGHFAGYQASVADIDRNCAGGIIAADGDSAAASADAGLDIGGRAARYQVPAKVEATAGVDRRDGQRTDV